MEKAEPLKPDEALKRVFCWSRDRDYAGYSKHDALNSRLLSALSLNNRFLRLCVIQGVMRFPVNIRPLLGVPRGRNPKGIGLFAHALLDRAEALQSEEPATAQAHIAEAGKMLEWLIDHAAAKQIALPERITGLGWGYHYPWQDVGFFQPRHFPNRVVTSWIGFAFLRAHEVTGDARYVDYGRAIAQFLLENPRVLYEDDDQLCLSYVPLETINWAVMDVSALTSAFCARLASRLDLSDPYRDELLDKARKLMTFVVDKQTEYGAWHYTWPAGDSHIKHDNYHSGIILDCLADYMSYAGDQRWEPAYRRGLEFYHDNLFTDRGAPRWTSDTTYPHDIHGAAAGILAFSRASRYWMDEAEKTDIPYADACRDEAARVLNWTLEHLYHPDGYFMYQEGRWRRKCFCLMRWCNAWMCRAMAQLLLAAKDLAREAATKEERETANIANQRE